MGMNEQLHLESKDDELLPLVQEQPYIVERVHPRTGFRYVLRLAYDGTNFSGFQRQSNALGVQEAIETVLTTLLRCPIIIVGAGRTDAGVHASGMVVHFDYDQLLTAADGAEILLRANRMLGSGIVLLAIFEALDNGFNARGSALSRRYHYRISRLKHPFVDRFSLYHPQPLEVGQMQLAAERLLHHQDFASFAKLHGSNRTTICRIFNAQWIETGPVLIFEVSANRFLRGMVRALVGSLLKVGRGQWDVQAFEQMIQTRHRSAAAGNAPANGLFLVEVAYPPESFRFLTAIPFFDEQSFDIARYL
jgi:tRNA pseudouridine38-40 synthase